MNLCIRNGIWFNFDHDWVQKHEIIKRDPYRYILSKRDYDKCYNRFKRFLFTFGSIGIYFYYNLRYHQELGLVKGLKMSPNFYIHTLPKAAGIFLVTWIVGYSFLVDFDKKKKHDIAKLELKKFDPQWFVYDDYKYVLHNAPVYHDENSMWGRLYLNRLLRDYFQVAGWIRRRREANPAIEQETPPKYDTTPEGPRSIESLNKMMNQREKWMGV